MIQRITFEFDNKQYEVLSKDVDVHFHPYLIRITNLTFEDKSKVIVTSLGDDARKRFGEVEEIMIPMSQIKLIETIPSAEEKVTSLRKVSDS